MSLLVSRTRATVEGEPTLGSREPVAWGSAGVRGVRATWAEVISAELAVSAELAASAASVVSAELAASAASAASAELAEPAAWCP